MNTLNTSMLSGGRALTFSPVRLDDSTRWIVALMGLVLLASLVALATRLAQDPERFPVNQVDVLGTMDYADRQSLMADIKRHTLQGFYGLDIDSLRQSIESSEWIASARISRVWPERIVINVEEHEPAARWNDDHLISKRLVLFKPHQLERQSADFERWSEVFRPLPQVLGAQGRHVSLLDAYRVYDQQLGQLGLSMSLLEEDDRLSQTLTLSSGEQIRLGRNERELRMNRFLDVYERVKSESEQAPLSFDMRYSNGFAVGLVNSGGS